MKMKVTFNSLIIYWQPVKASVAAVVDAPAATVSVPFDEFLLVCRFDGLQSVSPAEPGTNAFASII